MKSLATVLMVLLSLAAPLLAAAECAWVFWSRSIADRVDMGWTRLTAYPSLSACRTRLYQAVGVPAPGSLRDWYDWLYNAGQYREKRPPIPTTAHASATISNNEGFIVLGP